MLGLWIGRVHISSSADHSLQL